ncbi:MAG: S9 family peptidase [Chitinophaga sp.]|uniref:alpha/beta hydrolase family protein n=1 Tax=Chitinophaga sp. TaxID=1869181 RepID=UPI001B07785B|nr:prolyl oligopeptidase family serine peptidase [Chitinophaga sp.]MBO9727320.1 S9 family peptidase [Chitinophaga sp.]
MRFLSFFSLFMLIQWYSFGQNVKSKKNIRVPLIKDKILIDSSCFGRWPVPQSGALSDNGKFAFFFIENEYEGIRTLVLIATEGLWKREFGNIDGVEFTADSKRAIVTKSDKVYIVNLGTSGLDSLVNVNSHKLSVDGERMACQLKDPEGRLVVLNFKTQKRTSFFSVVDYLFKSSKEIVFVTNDTKNNVIRNSQTLYCVNADNGVPFVIWQSTEFKGIVLSNDSSCLAFISTDKNSAGSLDSIGYYKFGSGTLQFILSGIAGIQNDDLKLSQISRFSTDNTRLFILLEKKKYVNTKPSIDPSLPEVWNFNDKELQSEQILKDNSRTYSAVIDIQRKQLFRLESEHEVTDINYPPLQDSIAMVTYRENNSIWEADWNPASSSISYIISTKTGKSIMINEIGRIPGLKLSSYGKYLIYYNMNENACFTYEIGSGVIRNISKGANSNWEKNNGPDILGWLKNDSGVVIADRNDLWLLDPTGVHQPVNVTNGYGKRNNIVFFLTWKSLFNGTIDSDEPLFLTALNSETKENGFFSAKIGQIGDPVQLTMGPFIYDIPSMTVPQGSGITPMKAAKANAYIIRRMSAKDYPNLLFTTDFKKFRALTNFQPQTKYNWYTTELHEWKAPDGTLLKGILYKPENFDSSNRYPIIFNFYEKKSDGLNAFIRPEQLSGGGNINIPYYVSNGYLIFCPDIEYRIGDPLQGTYDAILSAAEHVSKLPFVDARKMALQGFSWGAIQANYLSTVTEKFAAICSVSGTADWISGFGSLTSEGHSLQGMYVTSQMRIGATLWEKPEIYIKNSAVLGADKVSTPILLVHTKDDGGCLFSNVIEFFTALRRLGKKSWMLVYPGDHGIEGREAVDMSIRMKQFFDHYLKDMPAPIWMTKGIPARLKGIDRGLSLDSTIKTPTASLLVDPINKAVRR